MIYLGIGRATLAYMNSPLVLKATRILCEWINLPCWNVTDIGSNPRTRVLDKLPEVRDT